MDSFSELSDLFLPETQVLYDIEIDATSPYLSTSFARAAFDTTTMDETFVPTNFESRGGGGPGWYCVIS